MFQRGARGVITTHAVDSATRRRRGRAKIETIGGKAVGIGGEHGTQQELREIVGSAADVAADEVGIQSLHGDGVLARAGEDAIAETRSKALDLCFDRLGPVFERALGYVAIGPSRVLALGSARNIEETLLGEEDPGSRGESSIPAIRFAQANLVGGSAEVKSG